MSAICRQFRKLNCVAAIIVEVPCPANLWTRGVPALLRAVPCSPLHSGVRCWWQFRSLAPRSSPIGGSRGLVPGTDWQLILVRNRMKRSTSHMNMPILLKHVCGDSRILVLLAVSVVLCFMSVVFVTKALSEAPHCDVEHIQFHS